VLWQSRLPQRNLPDSDNLYDGDTHNLYDGDTHYHYDGDSQYHDFDAVPTERRLLHYQRSVL
jgi:hypothetical protein